MSLQTSLFREECCEHIEQQHDKNQQQEEEYYEQHPQILFSQPLSNEIDMILAHGSPFTRGPNSVDPLNANVRRLPPRCTAPPRWLRLLCQMQKNVRAENRYIENATMNNDVEKVKSKIRREKRMMPLKEHSESGNSAKIITNVNNDNSEELKNSSSKDAKGNKANEEELKCAEQSRKATIEMHKLVEAPDNLIDLLESPSPILSIASSASSSRSAELRTNEHEFSQLPSSLYPEEEEEEENNSCLRFSQIPFPCQDHFSVSMTDLKANNTLRREQLRGRNGNKRKISTFTNYTNNNNNSNNRYHIHRNVTLSHNQHVYNRTIHAPLSVWSDVYLNEHQSNSTSTEERAITILLEKNALYNNNQVNYYCCHGEMETSKHGHKLTDMKNGKPAMEGVMLLTLSSEEFATYTVLEVKKAIKEHMHVAVKAQRLFVGNVLLRDELPIALIYKHRALTLTLQVEETCNAKCERKGKNAAEEEVRIQNNASNSLKTKKKMNNKNNSNHHHHSRLNNLFSSLTSSSLEEESSLAFSSSSSSSSTSIQSVYKANNRPFRIPSSHSSASIKEVTEDAKIHSKAPPLPQSPSSTKAFNLPSKYINNINNNDRNITNEYLKHALVDALPPISVLDDLFCSSNNNNKCKSSSEHLLEYKHFKDDNVDKTNAKELSTFSSSLSSLSSLSSSLEEFVPLNHYNAVVKKETKQSTEEVNKFTYHHYKDQHAKTSNKEAKHFLARSSNNDINDNNNCYHNGGVEAWSSSDSNEQSDNTDCEVSSRDSIDSNSNSNSSNNT